jgi:serine/threonine protein phosphatase PrpC
MANDSGRIPGGRRSPGAEIFRTDAGGGPAGVWAESSSRSNGVCGAGVKMVDSLEMATATHTGMVRSHNEDSVIVEADIGLAVLADGMGGYNAGEVASGIATALITDETKQALMRNDLQKPKGEDGESAPCALLHDVVAKANDAIYQAANNQPQYAGMGTTLVVGLFFDDKVTVAHIGDSRCYRLRDNKLEQITRDHSLLQEQIDSGLLTKEAARRSQNKNLVTRALGIDVSAAPEVHVHEVQEGDVYLMCSDGLNDMVEDEDIELAVSSLSSNLPLAASQLVQMANDAGGRDNVSVVLIKIKKDFPAADGWVSKVRSWFI